MKMLCSVKLSPHRYKTPEGYLYCKDAIIARTGPQTYLKSEIIEGSDSCDYIDVDRKPEEVFSEKTMSSFEGKPLTIEHPSVSVGPDNFKELAVGNVHNIRRGTYEGQEVMLADILVTDAEAISLIENGDMVELSCGYDCDITSEPNPEQINIRGNHIALCEQGRAGIARIQDSKKSTWGIKSINDSVTKGTLIQEFGKQGKQYKISKIIGNVIYAESLETGRNFLFKKDEEDIEWAIITKSEVKDSVSTNRELLRSKEPHYTITLEEATLYNSIDGTRRSSGYRETEYDDKIYDNFEEAKKAAQELFDKYKDKKENKEGSYSYYSVKITEWIEGGGNYVDMNGKDNGPFPALSAYNPKELSATLKKALNIKDASEEKEFGWYIRWKDGEKWFKGKDAGQQAYEFAKELKSKGYDIYEFNEVWTDEFYYTHETDMRKTLKDTSIPFYIISLDKETWLDENDRPTNKQEEARQFKSEKEAKDYQKIYCKGKVVEISEPITSKMNDSFDPESEIESIESLLKGIDYKKIKESWGSLTIDFNDKKELRKAGKILAKLYDIELFDDPEDLYIAIYDKFDKSHEEVNLIKDKEQFTGFDLKRGPASKEFKNYLRDRGFYFEPSDNGDYIHFEVKNADKFVEQRVEDIRKHWAKFNDSYSRKFYVKTIEALEKELDKLEKNELLDQNQEDYEIQKNNMRKTIKKQIEEYKRKLDE